MLAVNITIKIDDGNIAVLCRAFFNHCQFSVTVLQALQFGSDFLFRYFCLNSFDFQTFVFAKRYFRLNDNFGNKFECFAFGKLSNVDFRTVHRLKVMLLNCFCVSFRKQNINSILIQAFYAETGFKNTPWNFAFAETRYVYFAYNFLKGLIQSDNHFFSFNLNVDRDEVLVYFFPCCFHFMPSPPKCACIHVFHVT
ncbi:hypothetical protein D3C78_1402440 [compost metagenome]